ncbi:MAG: amidohydrolase family protein [Myxococcota bacterium]
MSALRSVGLALVSAFGLVDGAVGQDLRIDNARIWNPGADPGEPTTLVVRNGRIAAPGTRASGDAPVIDAEGRLVTPGFIAGPNPIGLVEVNLEATTRDAEGDAAAGPVQASFSAVDGYNPRSTAIPVARRGGVTHALSTPSGGLIAGTSALVRLFGSVPEDVMVEPLVAVHADLEDAGITASGGARPAAVGRLREALDDARLYARQRAAYDRRGVREMRLRRQDLERLDDVLSGRLPLVVRVARAADILRVLELAESYRLRLVLSGVEEGWRVAEAIAEADVPVIVRPLSNLPDGFASLGNRSDNATRLAAAGVRVMITTYDAHELRTMGQEAGNAVAHGLDRNLALAAVTSTVAESFGLGDLGRVQAGRAADFVIWEGDPFDVTGFPREVVIGGRRTVLESRQTELFRRYRDLAQVRQGRPHRPEE